MTSLELVQKSIPAWSGRLACHDICYNSDGHPHRAIPYNATLPSVALTKAKLAKSDGVSLIIGTWQGPWATSCNAAAIAMSNACTTLGMQFALLLDPGGMQKWVSNPNPTTTTANVIAALQTPSTIGMLDDSSYCPEKYILDFGTGANLTTLAKTFPNYRFLAQGAGFSWISIPTNANSAARNIAAVANLKSQHANPAMKIASFCASFNDAGMPLPKGVQTQAQMTGRDYSQSVWGGPARILDSFAGQFAQQQLATINPATPIVAIVSWADYDEQSSGPREKVLAEEQGTTWPTV